MKQRMGKMLFFLFSAGMAAGILIAFFMRGYLLEEFENDPSKIWESNIFGKSLYELVNEGLHNKLSRMPDESRNKMRETLQRIINEGSGGLICIIL